MSDMPQAIALFQKAKNESARKRLNIKAAFFWCTSKKESLAVSRMALAMDEAGFDDEDFARPIRVNLPVVDDLPDEGVFSTAFCDRYQLGDDGMTFHLIPGAEPLAHPGEKIVEGTDTTIVDGVDTTTGEVVGGGENDAQAGGEQAPYDRLAIFNKHTFEQKIFGTWLFGLFTELSTEQKNEVMRLSMDTEQTYPQNVFLAANDFELRQLQHVFPETYANLFEDTKSIWPENGKTPRLENLLKFFGEWLNAINNSVRGPTRPEVVEKWQKKFAQPTNRTPSGANAGGGNKTDRLTPQTSMGQEYEITLGLIARCREFDIYNPPLEVDAEANAIMNLTVSGDGDTLDEFLATRELFSSMPGGMDYSRACNVATVKTTPENLWRDRVKHREYLNRVMTETDHAHPDELIVDIACGRSSMPMPMARVLEKSTTETASNEGEKTEVETASDVQVQTGITHEEPAGDALPPGENVLQPGEGANCACVETAVTSNAEILAAAAPHLATQDQADVNQISDSVSQNSDSVNQIEPETAETAPEVEQPWPTRFEPGRYENVPNDVYHAANGISSTMLKDARISLMFFNARHIIKTIPREETKAFLFGGHSHAFILEPGKIDAEYAVPVAPPADLIRTTADMTAIIKEHNDSLPALMTPEEMKAWIETHNSTLTPPLSLSAGAEDTANLYMSLPAEFQRIPDGTKHTAAAQKACIKEYNASLPPLLKVSGTRDQLLDQIATVNPDFAEAERSKPTPLNTSGSRVQLIEAVRQLRPDALLADDFEAEQERIRAGRTYISLDMYEHVKAIEKAVFEHPSASRLLNHERRQSEVSYFGFDEDTGLELRVRPDIEIQLQHSRVGSDLKTVDLGTVKQERLRDRLHREIIERDYHLSAAMYCDVANLDQFSWIFVNKTPGYHWVVVVEASTELLELGRLEYRRTLRMINDAMETNNWPAPITEDYTDYLNDFDVRRLESLGME